MKAVSAVFAATGAYILYEWLRKGTAAGNLLFSSDRVISFRFDNLTPVFRIGIRVQNTSNNDFNINSFAANIIADGYTVGNASFFSQQIIAKNSQVILAVDFRLGTFEVVNRLIQAFQNKDFQFNVKMIGTVNVNGLQVPLNLDYKIGF